MPVPLDIQLLGSFRVCVGGQEIAPETWRQRRAAAILKLLALSDGHRLHREQLIEYLWPDLDPAAAGNNLRGALHIARRALEPDAVPARRFLQWHGDTLTLAPDDELHIDVVAFESAAAQARHNPSADAYRLALARYSGDLLPDDRYEDWTIGPRERLRDIYISLLLELAETFPDDDPVATIAALEAVVAGDPAHEAANIALMRAYARTGQRQRALRRYRQLRDALSDELDVAPEPAAQQLYGEILSGQFTAAVAPPVAASATATARHNLVAPLTPLIGRERELQQVAEALAADRLVTLAGPGGVGKTRLAQAAAWQRVEDYAGGVWLVELSGLRSPDAIALAIAGVLDVTLSADSDELAALSEALQSRRLLLVLDNCEHLIEGCARCVQRLLQGCPQLRILATSREPLRVAGEVVLRVPALELPASPEPDEIAGSEAVQLFRDRARSAEPRFVLTPANAPAVAVVCRSVDGLPLAIELAAARVAMFSVEQLATRLSDPLPVLTGGGRTVEPRQQTLRATLDWSFQLLDLPEQRLLSRLSVFAGGWTLEAAEQVCADNVAARRDVLSLLAQLVDKSLVDAQAGEAEARYRLLETVRQYAWERLLADGDAERLRERHAAYFLALAEAAEPELAGARQHFWLERLERDHDNLRAALDWATAQERVVVEARLCAALWRFWGYRSHFIEGERRLAHALAHEDNGEISTHVRARLLQGAGALASDHGDMERAANLSRQALALFQEVGDLPRAATTLHILGIVASLQNDHAEAARQYELGLHIREQLQDTLGIAASLQALGNVAREQGDLERASMLAERSLALQREIRNTRGVAFALFSLGVNALDAGNYESSVTFSAESLELFEALGDRARVAIVLNNLGYATHFQGDYQQAARFHARCLRMAQEAGDQRAVAYGFEGVATAVALQGAGVQGARLAARLYGAADALRTALDIPLPPADYALNERSIVAARTTLGEAAFEAAWAAGRETELEAVIAEALESDALAYSAQPVPAVNARARLSRRELEVASRVARGATNRQVAEGLHLSTRTVDKHVSNILRKLELSSRAQLATWLANEALTQPDRAC
jgi:predicted ATPase/DNA-binding SARP family transcriptional activator/DNA-binding CsgD family transcriptional regulator